MQGFEAWRNHGPWIESRKPDLNPAVRGRFAAAQRGDAGRLYDGGRRARARSAAACAELLGDDGFIVLPTMPGDRSACSIASEAAFEAFRGRAHLSMLCIAGLAGLPQISLPVATVDGCSARPVADRPARPRPGADRAAGRILADEVLAAKSLHSGRRGHEGGDEAALFRADAVRPKSQGSGRMVDFDAVYEQILAPAVEAAGMEVIRADQEQIGGTIHKPMFERLMLCDYAIADVTGANPNVYYELGIRHALRPRSTVIVFAEGTALPFDIASQRGAPYRLDESGSLIDVAGRRASRSPGGCAPRTRHPRRQPAVPADRRHAAARGRPRQDRHLPRPRRHRAGVQEAPGGGAQAKGVDAVRAVAADPQPRRTAQRRGRASSST